VGQTFEEFVNEINRENPHIKIELPPKEKPQEKVSKDSISTDHVRGDLARAMMPKLGTPLEKKQSLAWEKFLAEVEGRPAPVESTKVESGALVGKILDSKTETQKKWELFLADVERSVSVGVDKPSYGDSIFGSLRKVYNSLVDEGFEKAGVAAGKVGAYIPDPVKAQTEKVVEKIKEAFDHDATRTFLTALGADEHAIVKGLFSAHGYDKLENFGDYTYTNYLLRSGLPNDPFTKSMGFAMSVGLSPSTYLTFGSTAAKKMFTRASGLTFTKEGRTLVNNLANKMTDSIIEAKKARGQTITDVTRSHIARNTLKNVEGQVAKRFGEIDKLNVYKNVSQDVADLPESIISKGGAKLEVPFAGKEIPLVNFSLTQAADISLFGKTVVTGEKVTEIVNAVGLPQFSKSVRESRIGQGFSKTTQFTKDLFITNNRIPQDLMRVVRNAGQDLNKTIDSPLVKGKYTRSQIDMAVATSNWEKTQEAFRQMQEEAGKQSQAFFQGLNKEELLEFDRIGKTVSEISEKVYVKSTKGPNLQNKIDQWYGQGKYRGKGLGKELAEKSRIFEVDGYPLKNWYPRILKGLSPESVKLENVVGPAERKFLTKRTEQSQKMFTNDPINALAVRLTQISKAELQDEFYRQIIRKNMGSPKLAKEFINEADAFEQGYARLVRPPNSKLFKNSADSMTDALEKETRRYKYYDKDFVRQYEMLTKTEKDNPFITLLEGATNAWKKGVTVYFPSFHARNFNGNIIFNAQSIGGFTFSPKGNKLAHDLYMGNKLHKVFRTEIGERLSGQTLINEATKWNVLKDGLYVADLGGEKLSSELAKTAWGETLQKYAHPFSKAAEYPTRFGTYIENQARLLNYLHWRNKGLSPRAAAMEVNNALFNYGDITKFERRAKLAIPFYTFSKKNLALQARMLTSRPGVIAAQTKLIQSAGPNEQELREQLPEWAKDKLITKVFGDFYTGFGLPIEDALELLDVSGRESVIRSNPILRVGIEKMVGKDFYTDRDIQKINHANEFKGVVEMTERDDIPEFIKSPFVEVRSFLKLQRDPKNRKKIIGDPDMLHLSRALATSRFQSVLGMLQKENLSTMEKVLRVSWGLIKLEPDPSLKISIEKWKQSSAIKKIAEETNTARASDFYCFGGDPFVRKICNKYLQEIKKGRSSVKTMRKMTELFREKAERVQGIRTMRINRDN